MARWIRITIALSALTLAVGCDGASDPASTDSNAAAESAAGEEVPNGASEEATADDELPERIVTLGGAITETVYALDRGDLVVAVDTSSTYPEATAELPRVGYHRQLSSEGVLSVNPEMVIGSSADGPDAALEQIQSAGVTYETLPDEPTVEAALARVEALGALLGAEERAAEMKAEMERELDALRQEVEAFEGEPPSAILVYARGHGTLFVAGGDSSGDTVLGLAGAVNAAAELDGYQPLTPEAVATVAPDVIVIPESGLESIGGEDALYELPGIAQTPAAAARNVVTVDTVALLGFGPRFPAATRELAVALRDAVEETAP